MIENSINFILIIICFGIIVFTIFEEIELIIKYFNERKKRKIMEKNRNIEYKEEKINMNTHFQKYKKFFLK